jgi:hypothetical protein
MKITMMDVAHIVPYERNPRIISEAAVDAVAASIQQFGFRQPIVVDTNNVIIVGHARYRAALKLGLKKVPVHVATDLTPEQIKAYRIADNKTAEMSDWNYDLLPIELAELQAADYDLSLISFDPDEVARLLSDRPVSQNYTKVVRGLIYKPRMANPPAVSSLYNDAKLKALLERINALQLPQDLAYFFRLAAHRFVRFRFDLIAEYYAHASEDIKQIMRELVLVIVDHNDAIEAGVLKLSKEIVNLISEADLRIPRKRR